MIRCRKSCTIPEESLILAAENIKNNMSVYYSIITHHIMIKIWLGYTELSVKAIVPPGRRRRNASFTMFTIALSGHSWNCIKLGSQGIKKTGSNLAASSLGGH